MAANVNLGTIRMVSRGYGERPFVGEGGLLSLQQVELWL